MLHPCNVYLDIETTGLSSYYNDITVIGIYLEVSILKIEAMKD